jgi:RsiW-degrading membrane proteinase PrsW (M82 family)
MNPKSSSRVLLVLTIAYAITVAILGFLDSSMIGLFSVVGALILGGLWAVRAMFLRRDS